MTYKKQKKSMLAFSNILNFTFFLIQMKVNAEMCCDGHDCTVCTRPINFGAAAIVIYNYDHELAEWIAHFQGS